MTTFYLIRHGSANSTGENYDLLSPRGIEQSHALSEYFIKWQIMPDTIFTGSLRRQKETIAPLKKYMDQKKISYHYGIIEALNEVPEQTWKQMAEYLSQNDELFAQELGNWLQIRSEGSRKAFYLFYQLTEKILTAWKQRRLSITPTYESFQTDILAFFDSLKQMKEEQHVVIISSGTPISILINAVLGGSSEKSLEWLKRIWNTSMTMIRLEGGKMEPITINSLPHIQDKQLQSLV